jgi:hypothetical protein
LTCIQSSSVPLPCWLIPDLFKGALNFERPNKLVELYRSRFIIEKCSIRISADTSAILTYASWSSSVPTFKYRDSTLIRPRALPYKSIPIYFSSIILEFDAILSRHLKWVVKNLLKKEQVSGVDSKAANVYIQQDV